MEKEPYLTRPLKPLRRMMASENQIGRVITVRGGQLIIALDPEMKTMTRATHEGVLEVGRINSYLILPVGNKRIVAVITGIKITEEREQKADKATITLPTSWRIMEATMIGTIEGDEFKQGVSSFPGLDNPVLVPSLIDLKAIFGQTEQKQDSTDQKPGYCIPIGQSAVFEDYEVYIDPDAFFGKHAAIIGSTGAGKSCSVATIIQSILKHLQEKGKGDNTHFLILDTNGEYRKAFKENEEKNGWRCLYIPTDPNDKNNRLVIPYWFMNSEEFIRLFKAAPQVQSPVLKDTLQNARGKGSCVDSPIFFEKQKLQALELNSYGQRAEEFCASMKGRIESLLSDSRYDFLFGDNSWPNESKHVTKHALATFLRDILGLMPMPVEESLSEKSEFKKGIFPFCDRQREWGSKKPYNIVVVDLSLLPCDVIENVTALIGRLILEFLQRSSRKDLSGIERAAFPVVLVLEEAHNYAQRPRDRDDESVSRDVFERIAREGRKYGLSLVITSQRPSELSTTLLSQCNSFIVHRLQNPEDLRYFKEIVPSIYKDLLEQVPALETGYALVLGECVRAPVLVKIRPPEPKPESTNPEFYKHWASEEPTIPDVEKVCEDWEGKSSQGNGAAGSESEDSNEELPF